MRVHKRWPPQQKGAVSLRRVLGSMHGSTNKTTQGGINLPSSIRTASPDRARTRADHSANSFLTPHNATGRPRASGIIMDYRPPNRDHVDVADPVSELLDTRAIEQHELHRVQQGQRS